MHWPVEIRARLVVVLFAATVAALSLRAQGPDLCSVMPPGGDATPGEVDSYDRRAGTVAKCIALYTGKGQASITLYDKPSTPQAGVAQHKVFSEQDHMGFARDPNPHTVPLNGIGDSGIEVIKDQFPVGESDSPVRYQIVYQRGCYFVYINAGGAFGMSFIQGANGAADWEATREWVRATAAQIDEKLKSAPCPGSSGETPTPPPPTPGSLGVTISCQHNFTQADLVVCTASPSEAKSDAVLSYQWTFDGAAQSVRGSELTLTGVAPGDHSVSVIASDSVNQLTSSPQSVSFTKGAGGAPPLGPGITTSGSSGGGGGRRIPIVPIAVITTVLVGAAATAVVLGGRKKPLTPMGPEVYGAPLPPRPSTPPERIPTARPSRPPESARPPVPPERAQQPAAATPPKQQDRKDEGELWLDASAPWITLLGDGTQEVVLTVRACRRAGGAVVDASAEVTPRHDLSHPKKVQLIARPGFCAFAVRATHAGNTPAVATVTFSGTAAAGPVRPAVVTVQVQPVKIDVKITVWKEHFLKQEVVATLPSMAAEVRGKVRGGEAGRFGDVYDAHCTASLKVGNGAWSNPVEVRSGTDGTFYFGLPPRLVQLYGAELASYHLPATIEMGFDAEVERALHNYRAALTDLRRHVAENPGSTAYAQPLAHCDDYPEELSKQLREEKERDNELSLSAIHLLRCSLLFALKYRRDLHSQRRLLDLASQEALGSLVDVITDLLPMAMGFYKWLGGQGYRGVIAGMPLDLPGFPAYILDLARGLKRVPGMRFFSRGLLLLVRVLRAPVAALDKAVFWMLDKALDLARAAGLTTRHVEWVSQFGSDANEIPLRNLFDDVADPLIEAARHFAETAGMLVRATMKFLMGTVHALMLLVGGVLKAIGAVIRNLGWDAESGWANTVGEIIEVAIGNAASAIYDNFGDLIQRLITGEPPAANPAPGSLPTKNAADVIMDALVTLSDLDNLCAPEVQRAYERAHALNVPKEWQAAVHRAAKQELEVMARFEKAQEAVSFVDQAAPVAKLAVKIVQMVMFTWATVLEMLIRVAGKLGEKLGPSNPMLQRLTEALRKAPGGGDAIGFAGNFEKYIDVCELLIIRLPIIIKEIVTLKCIHSMAPTRIKALYEKHG